MAGDFTAYSVHFLIGQRLALARLASRGMQYKVSAGVYFDRPRSLEGQPDRCRISSRRDDEVIFELALIAVIDQVHALIDALVPYPRERWDLRAPP